MEYQKGNDAEVDWGVAQYNEYCGTYNKRGQVPTLCPSVQCVDPDC